MADLPITDAHMHLWDPSEFPYSWCAGIPALNRRFSWEDYLGAVAGTGIERAVFVECDVDEPRGLDEARGIERLAGEHPFIAGIVAAARPERADFPEHLEALLGLTRLRGIRRVLHVVPDGVSEGPLFSENVRRLAEHRLTFDLCVLARQLPLARDLVRRCPEVQFVLDHCGVPDIAGGGFEGWSEGVREIAAEPNVACKISGLVAYCAAGSVGAAAVRPYVERCFEVFGWDRVLFGGDWPVCLLTSTLGEWVGIARDLVAVETRENAAKLFSGNAGRIYRLE